MLICVSWKVVFFDLEKNRSQKLLMLEQKSLEEKQGQFWNLHQIPHKSLNPVFFSIFALFFDDGRFSNKITISLLYFSPEKTWRKNLKSGFKVLLGIRCRFQNCHCFSSSIDGFWLLFFWKLLKKYPSKNMKIVIFLKTKSKIKNISQIKCDLFSILHMLCKFR